MSYLVACYTVVLGGLAAYLAWLARARRRLTRELARQRTNPG